jgi:hypothetical protein
MWKYHNVEITPGKPWTDTNGIKHPSNWHTWSDAEKKKHSIKEIISESAPDSRLYSWTIDSNGKIKNKKAKKLTDTGSGESKVLGVKSELIKSVKDQQGSLLSKTDWYIIRKADKGTAIPSNVQTWRDAIRTKAASMEDAIKACSKIDDVEKLWAVYNEDGSLKSGVLYDWPGLGD